MKINKYFLCILFKSNLYYLNKFGEKNFFYFVFFD